MVKAHPTTLNDFKIINKNDNVIAQLKGENDDIGLEVVFDVSEYERTFGTQRFEFIQYLSSHRIMINEYTIANFHNQCHLDTLFPDNNNLFYDPYSNSNKIRESGRLVKIIDAPFFQLEKRYTTVEYFAAFRTFLVTVINDNCINNIICAFDWEIGFKAEKSNDLWELSSNEVKISDISFETPIELPNHAERNTNNLKGQIEQITKSIIL